MPRMRSANWRILRGLMSAKRCLALKSIVRYLVVAELKIPGVGFEPTTSRLCIPLRLSPPESSRFVVWTFPSSFGASAGKMPAVKSLHLLQLAPKLGSGLPPQEDFPTLTGYHTQVSSCAAQQEIGAKHSILRIEACIRVNLPFEPGELPLLHPGILTLLRWG